MKEVTKNTEFIIGIDFGHGETSAAFYNLKTQEKFDLDILPGHKVIKSAVAILEQEGQQTICVGDAAIANAPIAKDFQVSFKKRPSEMSKTDRDRMVAFMKGVYAEILDRHSSYRTREHVVFIARPSQDKLWKSEESAYLQIAEDAGLPVTGIQKESRAAYFRARTQPDSKIDQEVKKGVLIVDFGSSTIDFTYLNGSLSAPIDDGRPLGASQVEKSLLEYALSHPSASDNVMHQFASMYGMDETSNPYNQLLYKFREAKEAFYGKKLPFFSVMFDYTLLTSSEKQQLVGLGGISIPKDQLNKILGKNVEGGYIQNVKEAVIAFKNEKLRGNKIACVYLTGGASRMDFVREIFMEVFGLDDSHCPSDDNPSLIVSQGVAHLSYADIVTKETETQLKSKISTLINQFPWYSVISDIIRSAVKDEIKSSAHSIMSKWKNGEIYEVLTDGKTCTNLKALKQSFERLFISFNGTDFAKKCSDSINKKLVESILTEIKNAFKNYYFETSQDEFLSVPSLSASLSHSGILALTEKFTGNGSGHIIYDSIASRNLFMRDQLNMEIVRLDAGRKSHYNQYSYSIYSDSEWKDFLDKYLSISGIDNAKNKAKEFANSLLQKYAHYAKLAIFFK